MLIHHLAATETHRFRRTGNAIVNVKLVNTYTEFLSLEGEWCALWESVSPDNVFLHYSWVQSFIEAFGLQDRLYILIWSNGEQTSAILPLQKQSNGCLQMIGSPRSDYADLICAEDQIGNAAKEIFDFLFNRSDWSRLEIRELSERSILYRRLDMR